MAVQAGVSLQVSQRGFPLRNQKLSKFRGLVGYTLGKRAENEGGTQIVAEAEQKSAVRDRTRTSQSGGELRSNQRKTRFTDEKKREKKKHNGATSPGRATCV